MAQMGGIGIVHKNMTIDQQAAEVRNVKKFEAGVIRDPITVRPDDQHPRGHRADPRKHHISGVPVVDGARIWSASSPAATCASNQARSAGRRIMTPKDRLVTVREGAQRRRGAGAAAQAPHREGAGGQ
jgi:IMP dehydrogenase